MEENKKSIKIIIILIILIVAFIIILVVLNYNGFFSTENNNNTFEYSENNIDKQKLSEDLYYVFYPDDNIYKIFNNQGEEVNSVYNESELEFYKDNSDFDATFGVYQEAQEDGIDEENMEMSQE